MKHALIRQALVFILLPGSTLALAQVNDSHSHQNHAEQAPLETAHDHGVEDNPGNEVGSHSQHGPGAPDAAVMPEHNHQGVQAVPAEDGHQHASDPMDHGAMSEPVMQDQNGDDLRDPHAYSNGYELTSGPYLLEERSQIGLADGIDFVGLWVDRLEYVESHDLDATEFEGHAWVGDSYNRFLLRSEIEIVDDTLETAELDLLHTRAISPFWNVQFGLRREFGEQDERNWASIGLSGLAPYWFDVDVSLFLGENGNSLLDVEAEYDLLLTQRLVMQPRIDIHSNGKADREMGRGAGLSLIKTGFRLRYEFDRQLAPYFGYERVVKYGETADLLPAGEDRTDNHWIVGFKFWF